MTYSVHKNRKEKKRTVQRKQLGGDRDKGVKQVRALHNIRVGSRELQCKVIEEAGQDGPMRGAHLPQQQTEAAIGSRVLHGALHKVVFLEQRKEKN